MRKIIVFSKSIKKVTWKNSKLYHRIDPEEVLSWKKYPGKDLAIFGSGKIVEMWDIAEEIPKNFPNENGMF